MGLTSELRDYRLGLVSPLNTAHGVLNQRNGVLFSISDGVHRGWGEAAPMPGWSSETPADCRRVLEAAASRTAECDSVDDPGVTAILAELEARPHARAAVAGAVLDLTAQDQGVSVSLILCGLASGSVSASPQSPSGRCSAPSPLASGSVSASPQSVSVNGLISHVEPSQVAAAAADLVADGITAVKLKVAAVDPTTDLARVAAARSAIGDDIELRLDANGGWDVDTAVDTLRAMADHDLSFCEEPTSGIDGIAAVGAAGVVPVAVDESAVTLDDVAIALRTEAISVVVIKPQALGGPDMAMAAAALLEEFGADGVVTTMVDSAVGVAHAAHVAAAALPLAAHGLHTSHLLEDDVAPRLRVADGRLHLPQTIGLGVSPVR